MKKTAKRSSIKVAAKSHASTQTYISNEILEDRLNLEPKVVIDKLNESSLSKASNVELIFPKNTQQSSSIKTGCTGNVQIISRVPSCYRRFSQVISADEHANSTLLSIIPTTHEEPNKTTFKTRTHTKHVHFAKPGPLCSKISYTEFLDDDLRRPEMLGDEFSIEEENVLNKSINLNLDSILEETEDTLNKTIPPQINLISNITINEPDDDDDNSKNDFSQVIKDVDKSKNQPKKIELQFEGVTSVVSASRTFNNTASDHQRDKIDDNEDYDDGDPGFNFFNSGREYISIKANNVHIHNHFYT